MDQEVVTQLEKAGIDTTFEKHFPSIAIRVDEKTSAVLPLDFIVPVQSGEKLAAVTLKPLSQLFVGSRQPPSFAQGPTDEYLPFFIVLEMTAVDYCKCSDKVPYDVEFKRVYRELRRRPDGTDPNPIFTYLQAAARLYLSLREVSRAEFEAVAQRLSRSASRHSQGVGSRNYFRNLSEHLSAGR